MTTSPGPSSGPRPPVLLVVLDGWGLRAERDHNAIALARTPTWDELLKTCRHSALDASGEAVGLPAGQMGNSEVGHMNMGAGRVVYQDLTRIDQSIRDGELFENPVLRTVMERCRERGRTLHLLGLVSAGGVHSHQRHLEALLDLAARLKLTRVLVHALTDGRDSPPTGARDAIGSLEQYMRRAGVGRLASVSGRYYGMDRDRRWDRTRRSWDAIVQGQGAPVATALDALEAAYAAGITDEFIEPAVVSAGGRPVGTVQDGDSVLFFNFRADRARQLTRALAFSDFDGFERSRFPAVTMATMTSYDRTFDLPVVFEPQVFTNTLGEVLSSHRISNLRLAETEKYAHVTYFFNCGIEAPYPGEDRLLVPSPTVATYDLQPAMSAGAITDNLVRDLDSAGHRVVICNFANADMVGHTGNLEAAVLAVETLDGCLARILGGVRAAGGTLLVTADHGNAEQMWDAARGEAHTAHTSNPVPIVLADYRDRRSDDRQETSLRPGGSLRDVAPTILGLLELEAPPEMSGRDLRVS